MEHLSRNEEETKKIAANLILNSNNKFFCLYGNLGAGKTAFVKGVGTALGITEREIKSPTFTIVRSYPLENGTFYHYDFYRQEQPDTLLLQELEERVAIEGNIFCIEWSDRIKDFLPSNRVDITLEAYTEPDSRLINIVHHG